MLLSLLLSVASAMAACATDMAPPPELSRAHTFENIALGQAREMPSGDPFAEGRRGPTGGTVFDPTSAAVVEAVSYRFSLGHCGLLSPVDVDGSFWDTLDGTTAAGRPLDLEHDTEMINQTAGVIAVIGNEARFRTESGAVVRFNRHDGDREFPGCD